MRALLPGEDRIRFEQLIGDVEQAVWEAEDVTAELAQLIAFGIVDAGASLIDAVDLPDVVTGALRSVDHVLASRGIQARVDGLTAALALGTRDRLEHLVSHALAIAALALPPRGVVTVAYTPAADACIALTIAPYRPRDPRAVLVSALARSQGAELHADDAQLTLWLPEAVAASIPGSVLVFRRVRRPSR